MDRSPSHNASQVKLGESRIILGVDPGTRLTGYAFIEERKSRIHVLEYGVIRSKAGESLSVRLHRIYRDLTALMEVYQPSALALESIFFAKFARAALILGHARGAILVAAQAQGIAIAEYPPTQVKQAVTGRGNATKDQVATLMQANLNLKQLPTPADAADALAIAYCHLYSAKSRRTL